MDPSPYFTRQKTQLSEQRDSDPKPLAVPLHRTLCPSNLAFKYTPKLPHRVRDSPLPEGHGAVSRALQSGAGLVDLNPRSAS